MITLDLTIPTCWQELTQKQLRYAFYLISEGYTPEALKTKDVTFLERNPKKSLLFRNRSFFGEGF